MQDIQIDSNKGVGSNKVEMSKFISCMKACLGTYLFYYTSIINPWYSWYTLKSESSQMEMDSSEKKI